jgi:hypothetical protein
MTKLLGKIGYKDEFFSPHRVWDGEHWGLGAQTFSSEKN